MGVLYNTILEPVGCAAIAFAHAIAGSFRLALVFDDFEIWV